MLLFVYYLCVHERIKENIKAKRIVACVPVSYNAMFTRIAPQSYAIKEITEIILLRLHS